MVANKAIPYIEFVAREDIDRSGVAVRFVNAASQVAFLTRFRKIENSPSQYGLANKRRDARHSDCSSRTSYLHSRAKFDRLRACDGLARKAPCNVNVD